jgi:hypothetical protein
MLHTVVRMTGPEAAAAREAEIEAMATRLSDLMGVINTATAELVTVIAHALATELWAGDGIRSPEHWVRLRCGVSVGRARRLVCMARRRGELPKCEALFDQGALTEDTMAAIARRVPPERDPDLAELAPMLTAPQVELLVRHVPEPRRQVDEPDPAPSAPEPEVRRVEFGYDERGAAWWLHARLPADEGAVLQKAIEAARDNLFHASDVDHRRRVGWPDALVHLARTALDGAFDRDVAAGRPPADRNQVILHLSLDGAGLEAHLHRGPPLPDVLRRYMDCDTTVRAVLERDGVAEALTTRQRVVDDRLRVLVEERDRCCRVPGCAQRRWLHMHHVVHWEDGGPTTPANLVALCPFHHRAHHRREINISGDPTRPDGLSITDRHGRPLGPDPPTAPSGTPPPGQFKPPLGEPFPWGGFMFNPLPPTTPD